MEDHYNIAIIGGGPAGLMAAIESFHPEAKVVILEKMRKPALKLRITGKGRCNITNEEGFDSFINRFGKKGRFLKEIKSLDQVRIILQRLFYAMK